MPSLDTEWIVDGMRERHFLAAGGAVVVSFAVHALFYFYLPGLIIASRTPAVDAVERERKEFQLKDVYPERPEDPVEDDWFAGRDPDRIGGIAAVREIAASVPAELLQPRAPAVDTLAGEEAPLSAPERGPEMEAWQPRQEILAVEQRLVRDDVALMKRRMIPDIERVVDAPDFALPVDRKPARIAHTAVAEISLPVPKAVTIIPTAEAPVIDAPAATVIPEDPIRSVSRAIGEASGDVTDYKQLEDLLATRVTTYRPPGERVGYFRLDVQRKAPDLLPVLPKDVIFMQDCSASVTEQRLYFCRAGLTNALMLLGPDDRFNVVAFRDTADWCFPKLAGNTPAAIERAVQYIGAMEARGETDIYASVRGILEVPNQPGRPLIVLLVTDGMATTGVTDSSRIIADFSKENDASRSVFTMGLSKWANQYLLDLLGYRNRGDGYIVKSGRWDIPAGIVERMRQVSRPILTDMRFSFTDQDRCQVYPSITSNLYEDRPLVLYGRYESELREVYLQVIGLAGQTACDMVFQLDLESASRGDIEIQKAWVWQYVYHLIGEHTRTRDRATLRELRRVAREYDIDVPYRGRL